ncbi:MAG: hypothetical protein HY222_04125 [Thaumarchaeota archaeon]|nr:hypothetical protein [Nitrososphaerota archaeon]MBI3641563.1 hypothetical protein [Nitrososphaerota archaeon]
MKSITCQEIYRKAKVGTVAGIIGGFAIIASFIAIDLQIGTQPGTFYMMIGLAVGLHGTAATIFGFIAHMLTAATIGAVFCVCSLLHPMLNLRSVWKGIFAGGITGLEVYAIFFMPITLFLIMPTIDTLSNSTTNPEGLAVIKSHLTIIMWGALLLHILYGSTMGFFSGMKIREDYKIIKKPVSQ